jgi:hypothetical protein
LQTAVPLAAGESDLSVAEDLASRYGAHFCDATIVAGAAILGGFSPPSRRPARAAAGFVAPRGAARFRPGSDEFFYAFPGRGVLRFGETKSS